jgi:hypothetical protein
MKEIDKSMIYQKAQDSAEHHNKIMWTLIYVGIGLSLWILYSVLSKRDISVYLKFAMLFFGAFVLWYFNIIIEKSNKRKNQCYKICHDIEKNLEIKYQIHKDMAFKGEGIKRLRFIMFLLYVVYIIGILVIGAVVIDTTTFTFKLGLSGYFIQVILAAISLIAVIYLLVDTLRSWL